MMGRHTSYFDVPKHEITGGENGLKACQTTLAALSLIGNHQVSRSEFRKQFVNQKIELEKWRCVFGLQLTTNGCRKAL